VYILNKADLADLTNKEKIVEKLHTEQYSPCYFTNLRNTNDKTFRKVCYYFC
jgi:hypothetical protein